MSACSIRWCSNFLICTILSNSSLAIDLEWLRRVHRANALVDSSYAGRPLLRPMDSGDAYSKWGKMNAFNSLTIASKGINLQIWRGIDTFIFTFWQISLIYALKEVNSLWLLWGAWFAKHKPVGCCQYQKTLVEVLCWRPWIGTYYEWSPEGSYETRKRVDQGCFVDSFARWMDKGLESTL